MTGITVTRDTRTAWVSTDAAPAVQVMIGSELLSAKVVDIGSDHVEFESEGVRARLTFPTATAAQSTDEGRKQDGLGPVAKLLAPANTAGGAPVVVGTQPNGNAAFLKAFQPGNDGVAK